MNRSRVTVTCLVLIHGAIVAMLVGCASTGSLKDLNPEDLIAKVEQTAHFVNQFEAEFVRTRRTAMFDRELSVHAHLVYQKPRKFRLVTQGDVNVEILSDGRLVTMIHDGKDVEIHRLRGERDLSRFSDPMMLVLNRLGRGALRTAGSTTARVEDRTMMLELSPGNEFCRLERARSAKVWLGEDGQPRRLRIVFDNGDVDSIRFLSWRLLARDDPKVVHLQERLSEMARADRSTSPDGPLTLTYLQPREIKPLSED